MTGEHLAPDIQAFLRLLARHRVRYLVVGGEAVIHHGYARLTGALGGARWPAQGRPPSRR